MIGRRNEGEDDKKKRMIWSRNLGKGQVKGEKWEKRRETLQVE